MEFTQGKWKLEWVDLGEGLRGDYDPEDASDVPLLRADLYTNDPAYREELSMDGEWGIVSDTSYCTLMPVGTSKAILKKASDRLFNALGNHPGSPKRIMSAWTWTDPTTL